MAGNNNLLLPELTVKGFRGIDELSIPRLGRVTLLAGKNSVGKTTVLDALKVYSARGRYSTLYELLTRRDEAFITIDDDGDSAIEPSWMALFYGRENAIGFRVTIGPNTRAEQLTIEKASLNDKQMMQMASIFGEHIQYERFDALKVVTQTKESYIPLTTSQNALGSIPVPKSAKGFLFQRGIRDFADEDDIPPRLRCESLGPGLLSNDAMARFWDNVALTEDENKAVRALGLIFGPEVQGVAVIGDDHGVRRLSGRRVMVKLKSYRQPVPLKSLGDGALRGFGTALTLANSRNGFLLIDEAENGIHHTLQLDYWRMILQTAHENDVQVIATTHSWDCVKAFAQAAQENKEVEGQLVRLSRQYGDMRAVDYSEEELAIAAEQGIEVR